MQINDRVSVVEILKVFLLPSSELAFFLEMLPTGIFSHILIIHVLTIEQNCLKCRTEIHKDVLVVLLDIQV